MFLVDHRITTHHIPNVVAVNVFRRGYLPRAVDTLNRVERSPG